MWREPGDWISMLVYRLIVGIQITTRVIRRPMPMMDQTPVAVVVMGVSELNVESDSDHNIQCDSD